MMKFLILTISILAVLTSSAQNQGNIWYFGVQAGLDFNNVPPTPLLDGQTDFPLPNEWNEGSSSISDSSGALLFYTNGEKIWDNSQEIMPNGNDLMGHSSSTQSSIIVPQPNSERYFYVFTTDAYENNYQNGLRYSIVDMCLNDNKGDILPASKNTLLVDNVSEKLACIKHANGTDYWVLTHKFNSDEFYALRLTSTGITDTVVSPTGTIDLQGWGGQLTASPNGQKLAYVMPNAQSFGKTLLLDFDASTGLVSNEQTLSTGGREFGASFSPDNSKLYFSTIGFGELFQYDLNAGDLSEIIMSKTYLIQNGPDSWRHHQLGPDGKIYISRTGKSYISRIELPNAIGVACNYVDSAIYLGGQFTSFGLPNFITGYDYHNSFIACPTGIDEIKGSKNYLIYPNPASGSATLEFENLSNENYTLILFNSQGEVVKSIPNITTNQVMIERGKLEDGLYYFQLNSIHGMHLKGKLVMD